MKNFAHRLLLAGLLALTTTAARATDVVWTNVNGGQWNKANNWSPNKVPGASDNAFITSDGTYAITANSSITVSNLSLGGANGTQTFTVSSGTISCDQGTIDVNGVLTVSGATLGGGSWLVQGTVNWTGPTLSSTLNIVQGGTLNITGNNAKYLSGGQIVNNGTVSISGNGGLLFLDNGAVDNRGVFQIANDQPLIQAYSTNKGTWFANSGTFRKQTTTGATIFNDVQFRNSGTIDIQTGALSFTNKNHALNDGTVILGSGQFRVAGANLTISGNVTATTPLQLISGSINGTYTWNGDIVVSGGQSSGNATLNGNLTVQGGKDTTTASIASDLTISGGEAAGKYVVAGNLNLIGGLVSGIVTVIGNLNWQGGTLSAKNIVLQGDAVWYNGILTGQLTIPAGHSLNIPLNSAALIQGGTLTNFGTMAIAAGESITNTGNSVIYNYGLAILDDGVSLPSTGGGTPKFYNYGTIQKTNNGVTVWSDFLLNNSGLINVPSGTLSLAGLQTHTLNPGSLITGSGTFLINGATLNLVSNMFCSSTFELTNGTLNAAGAFFGNVIWSGGTLNGSFIVPVGQELFFIGGGSKTLASQSSLQINGYALMAGGGPLTFSDRALLDNRGSFEVQDDAPFTVAVNAHPILNNSGILRKTVSSAAMEFNALTLQNSGTIEIDTGEVLFSGGTHYLNDGSQVPGPSPAMLVGGVLNVNGTVSFGSPLQFAGGTLVGTGTINGGMIWSGGAIQGGSSPGIFIVNEGISWSGGQLLGTLTANGASSWSGGTLAGTLNILPGQKLSILRAGANVMTGALNNAGTITMDDLETLEMDSAAQLNNNGVFEVVTGTPWKTVTGNRPVFVNNGTFRKLSSAPLYLPADVEFRNYGTIEANASVVSFSGGTHGFYDGSSLTGAGAVEIDGATINLTGNTRISGSFIMASGALNAAGLFQGDWTWSGGAISGTITHRPGNQLTITGSNIKTLSSGASLNNAGTVILDGTGPISFYDKTTVNNSGLFEWRSAAGFAVANSTCKPVLVNSGTFRKTIWTGTLVFDVIQLQNSGILDIEAGVISFPSNTHYLNDGSQIIGSATAQVSGATMNLGGNVSFSGPFQFTAGSLQGTATINGNMTWSGGAIPSGSSPGTFIINGGLTWSGGTLAGTVTANGPSSWSAGTLSGILNVPAGQQLSILRGGTNIMTGVLNNSGRVALDDLETFEMDSAAQINNNGVFEAQTGTPWKTVTGTRPVFVNNGTFRKLGASALLLPAAVEFRHYGTIEAANSVVSFTGGTHGLYDGSSITGAGSVEIDGATINVSGTCKVTGSFNMASGLLNAAGAFNGNWTWSGGAISGTITEQAGNQLSITGSATKTLNQSAVLSNAGTVILDGLGVLALYDGATINNSGLFEWRGTAGFALGGSSGKPVLINSGTFRKTVSTSTLAFDVIQLQNSGVLDVQAGVISFPSNTHYLNNGSQTMGAAIARVSGATMNVNGNVTFGGPFEFTAGTLLGTATINGNMTWSGGTIPTGSSTGAFTLNGNLTWSGGTLAGTLTANGASSWSGGTLSGTLTIPGGQQMNILRVNTQVITGVLNNSGRITLDDFETIEIDNPGQVNNNGVFEAVTGTPWKTLTTGRGLFVNNGTFRQLGSGALLIPAGVEFRNYGALEAVTNVVSFAAGSHGFYDGGSIKGRGWVEIDGATINLTGTTKVLGGFNMASGLLNSSGAFDGNWIWSGGAISGTITHNAGNQLSISGNSTKTMNASAVLANAGTVILDGSGSLSFYDKATINNSGLFEWRSSAAFAVPSSSYNPVLINSGTFRKTISTAILAFDVIQLQNSGILDVQAGVISFPANTHFLNNGSQTIGPAITRVSGGTVNVNGTVNFGGPFEFTAGNLQGTATINGNMTWSGGIIPAGSSPGNFTVNGNLNWAGGTLNGALVENGSAIWADGLLYGSLSISPASQLTVAAGGRQTLYGALTNAGRATIQPNTTLLMAVKALLVNTGVLEEQYEKALVFSGNTGTASFLNSGTFLKTVSTRAQDFSAIVLQNNGILDLEAGDITFSANTHSFADGTHCQGPSLAHVIGGTLNANGAITLGGGALEVASGTLAGSATINGPMTWTSGTVSGAFNITGDISWSGSELSGSATENGKVSWSGGLLSGSLLLPSTARLNVVPSGTHTISGSLNNNGQVVVSNSAAITLANGITVQNAGTFEVQNETALVVNNTGKATFNNTGTLRKTVSTKAMTWSYLVLQNSGTLDIKAGEIDLALNSHNLNDGSKTTGSGPLRVAGATLNVAGNITLGPALILDSGVVAGSATFNGPFQFNGGLVSDNLMLNGSFTWTGGQLKGSICEQGAASWTGGEIDGFLSIATNGTLAIGGLTLKNIKGGTLTNNGLVTVVAPAAIQGDGGMVVQNFGGFNVPTSLTVTNPGGGKPTFNNYGALTLTNGVSTFYFPGNLSLFPSGRLEIEVGGRRPGIELSQIIGGATYNLDGGLLVRTVNGFAPVLGDRLQIMNCALRSGVFATYNANTIRLSPDYSLTNVTLLAAAPSLTNQPVSQTVMDGSAVSFTGGAYGSLPISYQWLWNGAPVAGATNTTLGFAAVHTNAEGNYAIVATNIWGSITSTQAALSVIIAPGILQPPQSLTLNQGQDALFTVGAVGNHLTCRWKFGDVWLAGATNDTLLVTNVTAANAGKYHVELSNFGGTVTSPDAVLTVIVPPTITQDPASQDVGLGSGVTLSIRVSGTSPFTYQWYKDGTPVASASQASYVINSVTLAMQGSYTVIVANPAGFDTSLPAIVRVKTPPQITLQPVSQTVARGTNVIFSIAATGVPNPVYQWQLNGVNISGATNTTLLLPNVQPNQSGTYGATVANSQGVAQSAPAELQVITPPIPFADMFANRGILYTTNGYGRGTNCGATMEAGEPKHAGKGSTTTSVWISWWAPANGIATFSTLGSDFDTVLAVYQGTNVSALTKIADDDDSAGFHCSQVSFNAQAGSYYQLAVAGVGATCGNIILSWNLLTTSQKLPQIVPVPTDVTGNTNDIIALLVNYAVFEKTAVQWFYQGQTLAGATNAQLVLPSLQAGQVGGYAVRLTGVVSGRTVVSMPCNLQINTEGNTRVSARNKFFDAFDRALTP